MGSTGRGLPSFAVSRENGERIASDKVITNKEVVYVDDGQGNIVAVTIMENINVSDGRLSAVPVQTVYDRDDGFIKKLAELAPDIKVVSGNYVDNDMQKSMDLTNDYISAYPDLIGVYGDNNVTGSGIALAIAELKLQDSIVGVAYDGNPEEISGIRDGSLKAILVQDLYNWGYNAVNFANDLVQGKTMDKYYNTGVTLVTLKNIDDSSIQDILDPSRLAR